MQPWCGPLALGIVLSLLQVCLLATLGPAFHGSELPYQILAVALLLGHSLAYRWAGQGAWLWLLVPTTLSAGILCTLRVVSPGWSVIAAATLWAVLSSASLAQLSIVWWRRHADVPNWLPRLYSLEMAGATLGLLIAFLTGPEPVLRWFGVAVAVAAGLNGLRLPGLVCLLLGLGQAQWLDTQRNWSNRRFYGRGLVEVTRVTPYQTLEFVRLDGKPYLYLDGLCHYDPAAMHLFNWYLAYLPAQLLTPEARKTSGALVFGTGSFVALKEVLQAGLPATAVELDGVVAEQGFAYFQELHGLNRADPRLRVVVDDARHFLHTTEKRYSLIVLNVPSPFSLKIASLFSREFMRDIRSHLHPEGVVSVFLGSPVRQERLGFLSGPLARAVRSEFPYALLVSSKEADNSFLYASASPLPLAQLRSQLRAQGRDGDQLFLGHELDRMVAPFAPVTLYDFSVSAELARRKWLW